MWANGSNQFLSNPFSLCYHLEFRRYLSLSFILPGLSFPSCFLAWFSLPLSYSGLSLPGHLSLPLLIPFLCSLTHPPFPFHRSVSLPVFVYPSFVQLLSLAPASFPCLCSRSPLSLDYEGVPAASASTSSYFILPS